MHTPTNCAAAPTKALLKFHVNILNDTVIGVSLGVKHSGLKQIADLDTCVLERDT